MADSRADNLIELRAAVAAKPDAARRRVRLTSVLLPDGMLIARYLRASLMGVRGPPRLDPVNYGRTLNVVRRSR